MSNPFFRSAYNWTAQFVDPLRFGRALRNLPWFVRDYRAYRKLEGAESISIRDVQPSLHERTASHELDAHYFYLNAWAARRIVSQGPRWHLDIASQTVLATFLSASIPVTYLDYRPLFAHLDNLGSIAADLTALPFRSRSVQSLSCLHVAEHVGLGRYGDPLDPDGTRKAAAELSRILGPGGSLYFAVPVGRPRVCFNAHRIHAAEAIRQYFSDLDLVDYSGVSDSGHFLEHVDLARFRDDRYACGMFLLRRNS